MIFLGKIIFLGWTPVNKSAECPRPGIETEHLEYILQSNEVCFRSVIMTAFIIIVHFEPPVNFIALQRYDPNVQFFNDVWHSLNLIFDLSTDKDYMKSLEKIVIYSIRRLFVDNAEIIEVGTLNITPCSNKTIPRGNTIFRLVKHT